MEENKIKGPLFHPTFGSRPAQIIGRDEEITRFLNGLKDPVGSRDRCTFFIGQRGMGKTALLLELAERAADYDYVVARVTAYENMNEDIIETIQLNGAKYIHEDGGQVRGFEAGAFGFTIGLTFSEQVREQYGFRSKLTLLCDKLDKAGKGILILVDEAITSEQMRQLAVTYQHLVGENKNIAIAMAGLPQAISSVLNDKVLTFLNRASKIYLSPINASEIFLYFAQAFGSLQLTYTKEQVERLTDLSEGFPYMLQLLGYYTVRLTKDQVIEDSDIDMALELSKRDMDENVFAPILSGLSKNDMAFLHAMAQDDGPSKMADIGRRMQRQNSYLQPYRARLIGAGIIEAPRTGEVVFAVPYMAQYLRKQ